MMREIKFRGKRIDNGKWAYGYYHFDDSGDGFEDHFITTKTELDVYEVDSKTVGQYIGLKDRNSVEIYEGDIVSGTYEAFNIYFQEYEIIAFTSDVHWTNTGFGVRRNTFNDEGRLRDYGYQLVWDADGVEFIGNIYDNSELLTY